MDPFLQESVGHGEVLGMAIPWYGIILVWYGMNVIAIPWYGIVLVWYCMNGMV